MTKLALVAVAMVATFATALPALARPPIQLPGPTFESRDGNKDGVISWDEALGAYPTLPKVFFNQADSNDDGVLDESEYTSLQGLLAAFGSTPNEPMPA